MQVLWFGSLTILFLTLVSTRCGYGTGCGCGFGASSFLLQQSPSWFFTRFTISSVCLLRSSGEGGFLPVSLQPFTISFTWPIAPLTRVSRLDVSALVSGTGGAGYGGLGGSMSFDLVLGNLSFFTSLAAFASSATFFSYSAFLAATSYFFALASSSAILISVSFLALISAAFYSASFFLCSPSAFFCSI